MANQDNGYMNYGDDSESDFKRKCDANKDIPLSDEEDVDGGVGGGKMPKANEYYVKELLSERVQIEGKYPHADRLLQQEISHARQNGKISTRDQRYVDIYNEKPVKVTVKVLVPVKEHPKFNFVGKLLGPKGNSLRRLQEDTMCKMAVMGRGSMKDRIREENFRQSLDPKYGHLNDELHVEICALAPPAEAYARVSYALGEVRKYLIPDSNDEIRQEQFRELVADGVLPPVIEEEEYYRGRPSSSAYHKRPSFDHRNRSPVALPPHRGVTPAKQKVLSMIDRSRNSIDEQYIPPHEEFEYERGYQPSPQEMVPPRSGRSRPAEPPMEYRREYYRSRSPSYVKQTPEHHHHHHVEHPPPPMPPHRSGGSSSSSAAWRVGGASSYAPPSSRNHSTSADEHYAPLRSHHPHRGGYPPNTERSSYRGSPYMRPPK